MMENQNGSFRKIRVREDISVNPSIERFRVRSDFRILSVESRIAERNVAFKESIISNTIRSDVVWVPEEPIVFCPMIRLQCVGSGGTHCFWPTDPFTTLGSGGTHYL